MEELTIRSRKLSHLGISKYISSIFQIGVSIKIDSESFSHEPMFEDIDFRLPEISIFAIGYLQFWIFVLDPESAIDVKHEILFQFDEVEFQTIFWECVDELHLAVRGLYHLLNLLLDWLNGLMVGLMGLWTLLHWLLS